VIGRSHLWEQFIGVDLRPLGVPTARVVIRTDSPTITSPARTMGYARTFGLGRHRVGVQTLSPEATTVGPVPFGRRLMPRSR
jgi:hypothetical protein